MLPGYGFSPLPDFQPHINAFHCRGENPSMWIPGSGDSQALSEDCRDSGPLLRPCHHKHVAVCRQETLAFIELRQPVNSLTKLSSSLGTARPTGDTQQDTGTLPLSSSLNGLKRSLSELQNGFLAGSDRVGNTLDSTILECWEEFNGQTCAGTEMFTEAEAERPHAVTTVCRPLHAALSLPLSLPLSSFYSDTGNSLDNCLASAPSSPSSPPEGSGFQSPESSQPQRRTSQGSLREKSIRECCVYSDVLSSIKPIK